MGINLKFSSLARIGAVAILPLVLAACESEEEKAARLALAQEIVETSLERCDLQGEFSQAVSYENRLLSVLTNVDKGTLDELEAADVTVCLDHRLASIGDYGSRQTPQALFYPDENVVSLRTDGQDVAYGSSFLGYYDQDAAAEKENIQIGITYTYSQVIMIGKVPSTQIRRSYNWRDDAQDYQALQDNLELLTPPLVGNDI